MREYPRPNYGGRPDFECVRTKCRAKPDERFRVPLCWDCAFDVFSQVSVELSDAMPESPPLVSEAEEAARHLRTDAGYIYFLRFSDRIKIGFSKDPEQRRKIIPHDEVLLVVVGTMREERQCHAAFDHLRVGGEWFRAEPDLLAFIDDLRERQAA